MKFNFELKHNIKYKIQGYNFEKLLNNLIKNEIKLKKIKKLDDNILEFYLYKNNNKIIKNNINKLNIKIINEKNFGFLFFLKNIFFRVGLVSAIIISIILLFLSQMFVFKIEVYGNEKITKQEIISCLKELGVNTFTSKNSINTFELEKNISEKIPSISLVSVMTKGTSLIINLQEKVINDEYQNVGLFEPLKANLSGRIKSIKLIQGTLNCKVGDLVKENDILVYPYIIDSSGNKKSVKAEAEIVAEVWYESRITHYDECVKTYETGKTIEKNNLYFLDMPIYVDKKDVKFNQYETKISYTYLSSFLIPIKIEKILYIETASKTEKVPFEDVKESLINEVKNQVYQKVENKSVINEYHTIISNLGINVVSYVVVVEESIVNLQ